MKTQERSISATGGWGMVGMMLVAGLMLAGLFFLVLRAGAIPMIVINVLAIGIWFFLWNGFFTLQPNEAAVLLLFGAYKGTVTDTGLLWANPFYMKRKVSLRARNLNATPIKVNDLRGNPIEIAAVVVWRVADSAKAVFDVERYEQYVNVQIESALRHLAMAYPYDSYETGELSLRGSTDEVSATLRTEIQERVTLAGVMIDETRLSHLAYAPEIASAMLQRQQAEAVVAARTRIVEGAVGMVQMALQKLEEQQTVALDEERKASMVSNLLVVLCGHEAARPVINAGTLYS